MTKKSKPMQRFDQLWQVMVTQPVLFGNVPTNPCC